MQTIKLHEATKQFKISNKLAMYYLEHKNIPVKSHSSVISMEQLELLREFSSNQDKYSKIISEFKNSQKKPKVKTVKTEKTEPVPEKKPQKQVDEPKKTEPEKEKPKIIVEKKEPPKEIREKVEKPVKREVTKTPPKIVEPPKTAPPKKPAIRKPHVIQRRKIVERKPQAPHREKREKPAPVVKAKPEKVFTQVPKMIQVSNFITYKELCDKLNLKLRDVDEKLRHLNQHYQTNQLLEQEDIEKICGEFKVEFDMIGYEDFIFQQDVEKSGAKQISRAPVVTVMGHVDHGKTTLLDNLRKTQVAAREAGGITQKIGAYQFRINENSIVFVDTPGHEAFTNLRARGAKVTDLVILVVAANEGVKPQTLEAINHALAAKVPIIVAINKIDMKGAEPDKVKQELSQNNILVEDWGGDIVSVEISAKTGKNLDALLEMIGLVAEMQELKAYRDIPARGTIIESRLDTKLGPLGTILIQHGHLQRGDFFICGNSIGKVKSIFNDKGETINSAEVPMPVELMGFEEVPDSGDKFQVISDIEKARKIIDLRKFKDKESKKEEIDADKKLSLQNLFKKMEESKVKIFPIIIKTDNYGSSEVIESLLLKKNAENLTIDIVHKGIGNINESDILLASTAEAIIIGFNVKASQKVLTIAKREKIEIKLFNVIYHLIEEIERSIKGEIEPEYITNLIGKIEVLQKFKISRIGLIAGCIVKEGKVTNKSKLKVMRGNDLVFEGELETLKRIKDEVSEVRAGTECGIKIKNFNSIEIGDIIEAYETTLKE
jgi:translation initiation factor IF-2